MQREEKNKTTKGHSPYERKRDIKKKKQRNQQQQQEKTKKKQKQKQKENNPLMWYSNI